MTGNKKHYNAHRAKKKAVQLMLTTDEQERFETAKKKLNASSAKELVMKLIDLTQ